MIAYPCSYIFSGFIYLAIYLYLVIDIYNSTILNYRTAAKRYVQQHDDVPPTLHRLYRYAKQVIVWKDKVKERQSLRQKQLMDEAVNDLVFCVSHTEEVVTPLTDDQQAYRLVTIESGASFPSDYFRLTETRREEYRPCPSLDTQRLRCLGGMAVSRILAEKGWRLGIAGRREEKLKELQALFPDRISYQVIDIEKDDAPVNLQVLIEKIGGMDLYFHSSGIGYQNTELELATIETNAIGVTAYSFSSGVSSLVGCGSECGSYN